MLRDSKGRFVSGVHIVKRDANGRFVGKRNITVSGYKGFDAGYKCRRKQYKLGETFVEPEASLCCYGMHFCTWPLDVLWYYPPSHVGTVYATVTGYYTQDEIRDADLVDGMGDTKRCTKRLSIGDKLSWYDLLIAACLVWDRYPTCYLGKKERNLSDDKHEIARSKHKYVMADEYPTVSSKTNDVSLSTTFRRSICASRGLRSSVRCLNDASVAACFEPGSYAVASQSADKSVACVFGDASVAETYGGVSAALSLGGTGVAITHGYWSVALSSCYAEVTGERSVAVAANGGAACANNEHSIAFAMWTGRVKGVMGSLLIGWYDRGARWVVGVVDGKELKPDVWYTVRDGVFVPAANY